MFGAEIMKLHIKEHDTGDAICFYCEKKTTVTYKIEKVPYDDGDGETIPILTGVCDECDSVIAIPHQKIYKDD